MRVVVTILCGGAGTRFWPASVRDNPKQFLSIFKEKPLITDAFNRATRITSKENIYMITTEHLRSKINEVFPEISDKNVIFEPSIRSTAPCLALGAFFLKSIDPDTIMIVLPADHVIPDHFEFEKVIKKGVDFIKNSGGLLTVGVKPTHADVGFGYIKVEENISIDSGVLKVQEFVEKPSRDLAKKYCESRKYFWNAGMFIWSIKDFLSNLEKFSKNTFNELVKLEEPIRAKDINKIKEIYKGLTPNSIDYALMEKSSNVYVVPASFKWSDVGHWLAVEDFGNVFEGGVGNAKEVISINSSGNLFYAPNKLVASMDLKDFVVVDSKKALMIIPKKKAQEVKKFVDILKYKKLEEYI